MSNTFGLDIGATSIKALSILRRGNTFNVEALGVGPAPARGLISESPEDLKIFSDTVRGVISNANIKQKEVCIALPESQVYTKIIQMPALSEKELAAALKYEMEQYIPLPLDQVKTDWQIIGSKNVQSKTTRILIVAASISFASTSPPT